jgi:class 3 adenylate cyclase
VELPGADHLPFVGDQDSILDEIEEFLTGVRQPHEVDRVLATVLYVSIKQSDSGTDPTVDASTTSPTQKFSAHVVREVDLFRGRNLNIDHHSAVALFDGPARAIRAAIAIKDSATRLAVQVGIGVHTGECDMVQERPSGTTVDLTRDISLRAQCSEVLVSATVRDLVVGSGLTFADHSTLKTPERRLDLYQVSR